MIFDLIIGAAVVASMVIGFRSGIIHTLFSTLGWVICLPAAFVLSPRLELFLEQNTDLYLSLQQSLTERFTENASQRTAALANLPQIISDTANQAAVDLASSFAESLASALFSILCFVIVIVGVKLLILFFSSMLSKTYRRLHRLYRRRPRHVHRLCAGSTPHFYSFGFSDSRHGYGIARIRGSNARQP